MNAAGSTEMCLLKYQASHPKMTVNLQQIPAPVEVLCLVHGLFSVFYQADWCSSN